MSVNQKGLISEKQPKSVVSFAWTATDHYRHYPPYVNFTGNRIAVRGAETFNGKHYEPGLYAVVELPAGAMDEVRASLAAIAIEAATAGETPQSGSTEGESAGRRHRQEPSQKDSPDV